MQMRFIGLLVASSALATAIPAVAQQDGPPVTYAIDAEQKAIAARVAGKVLPDGIYKQMFSSVFDQMGNGMMNQMMDIPMRDLAGMLGKEGDDLKASMSDATLKQVMEILDPAFDQRTKLMFKVMEPEMSALFTKFEPVMREGLATAYASRFNPDQLRELEAFFATPTGNAYAASSMTIFMDPAVMEKMMGVMPEMMKTIPAIVPKMTAAMEGLPKPKTVKDLNKAERAKLEALLGVTAKEMK
jgi:Uncharacterized protein conserved in bacteria (DUF2059)